MNLFGRRESDNGRPPRNGRRCQSRTGHWRHDSGCHNHTIDGWHAPLTCYKIRDWWWRYTDSTRHLPTHKEEEELAKFSKQILASTEDIWTAEFQRMARPIPHPNWSFTQGRYRQDAAMEMPRLGLSTARLINASIWISFFSHNETATGCRWRFANVNVIAHEVRPPCPISAGHSWCRPPANGTGERKGKQPDQRAHWVAKQTSMLVFGPITKRNDSNRWRRET